MDKSKHLIIGAGPAAIAAAEAIRKISQTDEITLVTREETLPYSPVVLPYLISKELTEEELFSKGKEALDNLKVNLIKGKEVTEIVPEKNEVKLADGQHLQYDKLLIATGVKPQIPPVESMGKDDIHTFRTYGDFLKLDKSINGKQEIAIYGAGLVAVEAAEKLCLAGHKVTIIARSSLLRKYFNKKSVHKLISAFENHGCKVLTNKTILSVNNEGSKMKLQLSGGDTLTVDKLLVATGVVSNFVGDKIAVIEGGIKVNRQMQTNVENIYAAGDVASANSFFDGEHGTCPILPEAVIQGAVAGANMAGEATEYKGWIPGNYLRCFDENLFSIGITSSQDTANYDVLEKEEENGSLKLVFKNDFLVGAEGLNMKTIHPGVLLYLMREQVPVKNYRELMLSKPKEAAIWLMLQNRKSQAI